MLVVGGGGGGGGGNGVSLWKTVRKRWDCFSRFVIFKVDDGVSVKFWLDPWCGEVTIRDWFSKLYRIASNADASMPDLLTFGGTSFHWYVSFIHAIQDWELESITLFMGWIYSGDIRHGEVDSMCWNPSSCKLFEVKSYYKITLFMGCIYSGDIRHGEADSMCWNPSSSLLRFVSFFGQ
jgi:hypothetical protein